MNLKALQLTAATINCSFPMEMTQFLSIFVLRGGKQSFPLAAIEL